MARSGGQIFEPGPHINAALANRQPRLAARLFDLAFIILILPSSSVSLASPFDVRSFGKYASVAITEAIFYNMSDR